MIFCRPMVEGSGDTQMPLLLMRSSYIALHYFTLPYTSHSYIKTDEVILQSCDVRCRPSLAFPVVSTQSKASEGKSTQSNATQSKARQPNPVNSGLVASLQFTSTMYARVIGTLMVVVEGSHFHVFDLILTNAIAVLNFLQFTFFSWVKIKWKIFALCKNSLHITTLNWCKYVWILNHQPRCHFPVRMLSKCCRGSSWKSPV